MELAFFSFTVKVCCFSHSVYLSGPHKVRWT